MTNNITSSPQRFRILLVEDNDDDVLLTKHAFKSVSGSIEFHVARDGLEALRLLRREPPYGDTSVLLPHMILLDLNMPRMDGRQMLEELKRDEALKMIPTVILTTSTADSDVATAYLNHANAYMTKPIELQEFVDCTKRFADFWLSGAAILPT